MATPLIRIPQEQGGTMYAFANAARDLTRAYYNPDINFEFSKFALLDLPVYADANLNGNDLSRDLTILTIRIYSKEVVVKMLVHIATHHMMVTVMFISHRLFKVTHLI